MSWLPSFVNFFALFVVKWEYGQKSGIDLDLECD